MPYTIETQDGIVVENIPDDVPPDSPQLKQRVAAAREKAARGDRVDAKINARRALPGISKFGLGATGALQNAYYGVKDVFTDLSPEERETVDVNKGFRDRDTAAKVGGFAGEVASFALPGGLAGKAITKGVQFLPRAAQLAATIGGNAAVDAGLSAAYATENKGDAAAMGAVGSVGGQVLGRSLAAAAGGFTPSKEAKELMRMGIQPTVGQGADQGSLVGRLARRVEEGSESVPIAGTIITNARQRAGREVADEAMRRAVPPGGSAQEATREGVDAAAQQFKKAYGVLDQYTFKPDQQLEQDVLNIALDPNYQASRETIDRVLNFFGANFTKKFQQGPQQVGAFLSGDAFKSFDSELGRRIRDLAGQQGTEALAERRMLTALEGALGEYRNRNLPPEVVEQLSDTDRAYAVWKRVARAGKYSDDGEITPQRLTRAVKAMSQGDNYARGRAFMQDLTDPASILRNRTPNSGTADRAALIGLLGGVAVNPVGTAVGTGAALGGTGLMYTRPGQKFLLGGYDWQRGLQEALRRRSATAGDVGAALFDDQE
jgi:hypothetical protein